MPCQDLDANHFLSLACSLVFGAVDKLESDVRIHMVSNCTAPKRSRSTGMTGEAPALYVTPTWPNLHVAPNQSICLLTRMISALSQTLTHHPHVRSLQAV